jgi:hypothetical protein
MCIRSGPENVSERSEGPAHTGNARKQPTWFWQIIRSVNPAWTSLPSGLLLSQQKSVNCDSGQCTLQWELQAPTCAQIQGVQNVNCCCWFVLWCVVGFMNPIGVRIHRLALYIGPNWVGSTWRQRHNSVSRTLSFKWKDTGYVQNVDSYSIMLVNSWVHECLTSLDARCYILEVNWFVRVFKSVQLWKLNWDGLNITLILLLCVLSFACVNFELFPFLLPVSSAARDLS